MEMIPLASEPSRERIGELALRYGYVGVDRDNIVDIAMEAFVTTVAHLVAERDAAVEVASSSWREALTSRATKGPSLAELTGVTVEGRANFYVQDDIAEAIQRRLVPVDQLPTCPLSKQRCTSWTCLVDVCDVAQSEPAYSDAQPDPADGTMRPEHS